MNKTIKRRSIEILEKYKVEMVKIFENMTLDKTGKYFKDSEYHKIYNEIILLELDIKSLKNISYFEQTKFL